MIFRYLWRNNMSESALYNILMEYAVKYSVELTKSACELLSKKLYMIFNKNASRKEIESILNEYGFKENVTLITDNLFTFNSNGGTINFDGVNISSKGTIYNSTGGNINMTETVSTTPGTQIIVEKGARIGMSGGAQVIQGNGGTFNANSNGTINFGQ